MNTPVSFELARLLKEKGFESKSHIAEYWNVEGKQLLVETWEDEYDSFHHEDCPHDITFVCSAPTIAEVVMWLYEKHGIWVRVEPDWDGDFWAQIKSREIPDARIGKWQVVTALAPYKSPTEAYEKAIEYCLNKLI